MRTIARLKQWICWDLVDGKKLPKNIYGDISGSNREDDYVDFATALRAADELQLMGAAWCFTGRGSGFFGIDIDDCLTDVFDEQSYTPWVLPIVEQLKQSGSYFERSPSFTGIKAWFVGEVPESLGKTKAKVGDGMVEIFGRSHQFFTFTGCPCVGSGKDVADGTNFIGWLIETYFQNSEVRVPEYSTTTSNGVLGGSMLNGDRLEAYAATFQVPVQGDGNNSAFRCAGHLFSFVDDFGQSPSDDRVLELMRQWNARMEDPIPDKELERTVMSAKRNGIPREPKTSRVLESRQSEISYANLLSGNCVAKENHEEESKEEQTTNIKADRVRREFPAECLSAPGFIADFVELCESTALYAQPRFALVGALTWLGCLCGRKVRGEDNARPNIYGINLGPTACGKEHSRTVIERLNTLSGVDLIGPEGISSGQGIVACVVAKPSTVLLLDEVGEIFAAANGREPWLRQIGINLMTLYSRSASTYRGSAVADLKRVSVVEQPNLCVLGTSTPSAFWRSLNTKNVSDGLVPRILVIDGKLSPYNDAHKKLYLSDPNSWLVNECIWWGEQSCSANGSMLATVAPDPRVVPYSSEARKRWNQHAKVTSEKRRQDSELEGAIWARVAERSAKLALLFACSRNRGTTIEICDMDLAIKLSNWLARLIIANTKTKIAGENIIEDNTKRLRRLITEAGKRGISRSLICRRTQWLRQKERQEIIDMLLFTGLVEQITKESKSKTGPMQIYYVAAKPSAAKPTFET